MIFNPIVTETFKQCSAKPLDEMEILYKDMMESLKQNTHIPNDVMNSFKIKDTLCPTIWKFNKLKSETSKQLMQISEDFFKDVDIAKNITIKDVLLVGSLANFNWSKFSDFDLHILIDFKQINKDYELVKDYFKSQRFLWNETHSITLHDFPVEIYVQDVKEELASTGIYSVKNDKWLKKPERTTFQLDKDIIKRRTTDLFTKLKDIKSQFKDGKYKSVLSKATALRDKIYAHRKEGLKLDGEFSTENIIFKILRRTQYTEYLSDLINKTYDKSMTLAEQINNQQNT